MPPSFHLKGGVPTQILACLVAWTRERLPALSLLALFLFLAPGQADAAVATQDLAGAIETGLTNLVKFGRWGALGILGAVFCLAWAQKVQDRDNHGSAVQSSKTMWASGIGFTVVALYQLVLEGVIKLVGADPAVIPVWVWG